MTAALKSSELLVNALQKIDRIKTIVSASAIGWYGADGERKEASWKGFIETDPPSKDF